MIYLTALYISKIILLNMDIIIYLLCRRVVRRFLYIVICLCVCVNCVPRHGNESDWLMDRGILGGISIVSRTDDLDDLHKRYIHKDVWDGLDLIESGSLLDELDVLGDDGGVGEEISGVGHFWSRKLDERFGLQSCFSLALGSCLEL